MLATVKNINYLFSMNNFFCKIKHLKVPKILLICLKKICEFPPRRAKKDKKRRMIKNDKNDEEK